MCVQVTTIMKKEAMNLEKRGACGRVYRKEREVRNGRHGSYQECPNSGGKHGIIGQAG